jgi:hypothetical protein
MPFLGRFLASTEWSEFVGIDTGVGEVVSCPLRIFQDVTDHRGGTSCWLIDPSNDASVERVVAAYTSSRSALESVHIKYVDEEVLKELNIDYRKTKGETKDTKLNDIAHYELRFRDSIQPVHFARSLIGHTIMFAIDKVIESLFASVDQKNFLLSDLPDKLLKDLARKERLRASP